ncbi:hypothetical protein Lesp02_61390 [Lentzea sp. NBRC 105346]|uniref:MAB_1171c family putative transporter n=1 Tax=Lentzea sp. NBRC 105346 TaxID=3032205 RepID=UPI00255735DC|nr:MAB_1171c family putative transporter [Lentzea sp. NBRC 105346]GLZ33951.1 hypothetical protein Lesp02_61390 [Lentzea sp. NBRC 105346]
MTSAKNILFVSCAVLWWIALAITLTGFRKKSANPAYRALLVAFASKGIALTLAHSALLSGISRWSGVANLGILLQHLFGGIVFTAAVLVILVFWSYPPERARRMARVRVAACAGAAVVLILLWAITSSNLTGRTVDYLVQTSSRPVGAAYLLVYTAAMGIGLVEIARLCWGSARTTREPWLRLGLQLTTIGSAIYLIHPLNRAVSVIAKKMGLNPLDWEPLSLTAIGVGTVLLVVGLTIPAWGQWLQDYRSYRRIRPLWLALYAKVPGIALEPLGSPWGDLRYRLYRMVIEIRDGWRALRPALDPEVASRAEEQGRAAGRDGVSLRAYVEAEQLKAALAGGARSATPVDATAAHLGDDFTAELSWLTSVAKEFR